MFKTSFVSLLVVAALAIQVNAFAPIAAPKTAVSVPTTKTTASTQPAVNVNKNSLINIVQGDQCPAVEGVVDSSTTALFYGLARYGGGYGGGGYGGYGGGYGGYGGGYGGYGGGMSLYDDYGGYGRGYGGYGGGYGGYGGYGRGYGGYGRGYGGGYGGYGRGYGGYGGGYGMYGGMVGYDENYERGINASLNGRSLQENMAWDTGYGRGRLYNGGYGRGGYYGRDYFDAPYYGSSFNYGYGGGYW
eukprot:CAMPEP_0113469144 /NCGR_PEP_ID=MMETSP0014_2-20120614/15742_1 /TAXON_ID=2857 /ORGANISM="Nitzschia sp." /LENGTH=244 /DNA_ID=CAMNT_0000361601 /DNA_START=244 /DNA_END=978 /DNA_ORIENTATION=- /assembly_acc=CAM_ASM_000159